MVCTIRPRIWCRLRSRASPARRDLKLKLLEVFFVWGNKDRFLQTARELASTRDQALPGEWEKIVIMGRQIAPEDALFANAGALAGAASGGVDLNLEGGQNRVDFDLLGEPTVSGSPRPAPAWIWIWAPRWAMRDTTGEVDKLGDDGVDFVLDDPERGNDATGSTREMPGAPAASHARPRVSRHRDRGAGSPHDPMPRRSSSRSCAAARTPTHPQKIDAAARARHATPEQTAELALDDLGLDLGALEGDRR